MSDGLLVRLKPAGPWRFGSDSGARDETAELYHSDSVYSAVTSAMETLGELEAWLDATARSADPAVRFSSCFPWQGGSLFVLPPRPLWPPVSPANPILRNAHFLPLSLVHQLLNRKPLDEDAWSVDPYSRCLVPSARDASQAGPFRPVLRLRAAVDRPSRLSHGAHHAAGVEFAPDAGLWLALTFAGESSQSRWRGPVEAAIRLLADSGFGGQRSQGWGRSESPEFETAGIGRVLLPAQPAGVAPPPTDAPEENPAVPEPPPPPGYWLFSLFRPGETDSVNWERSSYSLTVRGGRVLSPERPGEEKRLVRMVKEGSVISSGAAPAGSAADVAPEGFPHPVYRYGFPVCLPVSVGSAA